MEGNVFTRNRVPYAQQGGKLADVLRGCQGAVAKNQFLVLAIKRCPQGLLLEHLKKTGTKIKAAAS
jgi:hypothetical protein